MMDPLFVDLFAGDGRGPEDIRKLALAGPPWHGLLVKATEGLYYHNDPWLPPVWRVAHGRDDERIAERLGVDWWVSAYHYFIAHQDPVAQARSFLAEIDRAGGWSHGTMYPVVDVEEGNQRPGTTGTQVVEGVSCFVEIVKAATGRDVVLYAGHWLRGLGVRDRMGCRFYWPARYAATLTPETYTSVGWTLADTGWWQFCGDGESYLAGYPHTTPLGPEDISAMILDGGGVAALEHLRAQTFKVVG